MVDVADRHLGADEDEDRCESRAKVAEPADHRLQQEVERQHPEHRECVRGEHEEGVLGDREDGRDRVGGERDVGRGDRDDHGQHRRRQEASLAPEEEPLAVVATCHRDDASQRAEDEVPVGTRLDVAGRESQARRDQERAEDVGGPREPVEDDGTTGDESGAQDECADDAPQQSPVAVLRRHREVREDDRKHEDVVDREAAFDHVAGQVLGGGFTALPGPDDAGEADREREPDRRPQAGLAQAHLVCATVEDEQVDEQHREHPDGEESPNPERNVHEIPRSSGRRSLQPPPGAWRSGPKPG